MVTITLTLFDDDFEYLRAYLAIDARARAIYLTGLHEGDSERPLGTLPAPKPKPEPEKPPHQLLDGHRSYQHNKFFRDALRQANAILRDAARGGTEGAEIG